MEPISLLNLTKYAKVFIIITTAISITAAVCLTAASCKSLNCTTFPIPHKPATILISIINKYVFLIRKKQKDLQLHYQVIEKNAVKSFCFILLSICVSVYMFIYVHLHMNVCMHVYTFRHIYYLLATSDQKQVTCASIKADSALIIVVIESNLCFLSDPECCRYTNIICDLGRKYN